MSRGMQQMRLIVMEFGRFTIDSAVEGQTGSPSSIIHQAPADSWAPGGSCAGKGYLSPCLRVNAALLNGESHPVDGQHIGGNAIVDRVRLSVAHHITEAVRQDAL